MSRALVEKLQNLLWAFAVFCLVGSCAGRRTAESARRVMPFATTDPALVFAAAKKILAEDGFTISEENPAELFIAAYVPQGKYSKRILSAAFWDTETTRQDRLEVTVQVIKRPLDTGVRFSVQSVLARSFGAEYGREIEDVRIDRTFSYLMKILLREARQASRTSPVAKPSGTEPVRKN